MSDTHPTQVEQVTKACFTCGQVFPVTYFWKNRKGRNRNCRACCNNQRDKARNRKTAAQYYYNHLEQRRQQARTWKQKNKDRVRLHKQRYSKNHRKQECDRAMAHYHRVMVENPEHIRFQRRQQSSKRRLWKTATCIPFTLHEWQERVQQFFNCCYYCLKPFTTVNKPTQDHLTPLVKGGAHSLVNLVPACQPCNRRKSDRTYDEFLSDLPPLTTSLPRPIQIDASGVHLTL